MRYPLLRYYLERVLRDMGGISPWAAKIMMRSRANALQEEGSCGGTHWAKDLQDGSAS